MATNVECGGEQIIRDMLKREIFEATVIIIEFVHIFMEETRVMAKIYEKEMGLPNSSPAFFEVIITIPL